MKNLIKKEERKKATSVSKGLSTKFRNAFYVDKFLKIFETNFKEEYHLRSKRYFNGTSVDSDRMRLVIFVDVNEIDKKIWPVYVQYVIDEKWGRFSGKSFTNLIGFIVNHKNFQDFRYFKPRPTIAGKEYKDSHKNVWES